jgi:hypothetical protein
MSSLRDAAENALGKTPAWVFLCDPFSFSFSFSRRGFEKTRATRWGDGALAEIIRRRLWARSAGILYVNHLSVPREAVIAVAAVSCPGLRARFEPELEARGVGGAGREKRADEDDDEEDLATTLLHERLKRLFASSANSAKREDDENDKPFVPPTPVYLDDFAYSFVSRPAVAARVDLAGDGLDRCSFEWSGGRDAVVEVTGSSVVDALVFWTEYDVGDGGERMTTGPTRLTRSTSIEFPRRARRRCSQKPTKASRARRAGRFVSADAVASRGWTDANAFLRRDAARRPDRGVVRRRRPYRGVRRGARAFEGALVG